MALLSLTAGPIALLFDTESAFLRYVRLGEQEIVRGVFAAVRDADWNTVPYSIENLKVEESEEAFSLSYIARCSRDEIQFQWKGRLKGDADGTIEYSFHGEAQSSFMKNRIGLCVLHPLRECAGQPCRVEHVDGSITQGEFPRLISPHQPFKEIRAISHSITEKIEARVTMLGDTFEMEDQRNWTDASFKTYGTPLEIPFPVPIEAGETIEQSVKIELLGIPTSNICRSSEKKAADPVVVIDWSHPQPRPKLGFLYPGFSKPPLPAVVDLLRQIRPDHLRVDLWIEQDSWQSVLKNACDLASPVGAELEIALFAKELSASLLQECLQCLETTGVSIARCLLFHPVEKTTPPSLLQSARRVLKEYDASVPLVVGTNAYFAELNRQRPQGIEDCLACYSINPQVHAIDNLSLSETLEAQRGTVDSAVKYLEANVVISPITLRPRFNPNATSQAVGLEEQLETAIDPRQSTLFGAAWTVGLLSSLATHPNVNSLTVFEAYGPRGIVGGEGTGFPVAKVLRFVLECDLLFNATSSYPREIVAFGAQKNDGQQYLVLANLTVHPRWVNLMNTQGKAERVRLDAESVRFLTRENLLDE